VGAAIAWRASAQAWRAAPERAFAKEVPTPARRTAYVWLAPRAPHAAGDATGEATDATGDGAGHAAPWRSQAAALAKAHLRVLLRAEAPSLVRNGALHALLAAIVAADPSIARALALQVLPAALLAASSARRVAGEDARLAWLVASTGTAPRAARAGALGALASVQVACGASFGALVMLLAARGAAPAMDAPVVLVRAVVGGAWSAGVGFGVLAWALRMRGRNDDDGARYAVGVIGIGITALTTIALAGPACVALGALWLVPALRAGGAR
jgi:hypothetical protein